METLDVVRIVLGTAIIVVAAFFAARRILFLQGMIRSGQPAVGRTSHVGKRAELEGTQVLGQKKLLQWFVPGVAHVFAFWGFLVLGITVVEALGEVYIENFWFPIIGKWPVVLFLEDLFVLLVFVGIVIFAIIRLVNNPRKEGRASRFFGSHVGAAWIVLLMIFNVLWTLELYRGAKLALYGELPGAFFSNWIASLMEPLGDSTLEVLEFLGVILHIAVILGFLLIVLYSKHLHIGLAPINVAFSRLPNGLGPLLPMYSGGKPIDFEDPADDATFGVGRTEDFTWKDTLDFATCTECGRCQSQCPAWNTGKPLSPKLMIMNLREASFAKAPYVMAAQKANDGANPPMGEVDEAVLARMPESVKAAVERPLVGSRDGVEHQSTDGYDAAGHRDQNGPVIDEDALWSCTTCGACVYQCPVDIEHIDHFIDMRRYQVMIDTNFPAELNGLFKNVESKGNPWGMNASMRNAWIEEVDFDVRVFGMDGEDTIPDDVDYLFWVGCAGAFEDRAKKTTKAVAELLTLAGVSFMVLGEGETCNGDPARRAGNEFLFQMQAQQNVEVLNEIKAKKIVVTCPHCLNTLGREYPQVGGNYEVVHHSQLLATLVREGRLTPVTPPESGIKEKVTYHDPCYLGRHNNVYVPPRELVESVPGVELVEMPRHGAQSFCCGAGGARMWMEEKLGTRVNVNRAEEAVATGAAKVAVACPFCSVMLNDAVTSFQQQGQAEGFEVVDLASLLLSGVKQQG
ncbi:MAG: FeS-binding protein [Actinomycetales bacterium mxb001]|nr:MAG: FeS-binding protein [Actinomycetales bacterium mxb001]